MQSWPNVSCDHDVYQRSPRFYSIPVEHYSSDQTSAEQVIHRGSSSFVGLERLENGGV